MATTLKWPTALREKARAERRDGLKTLKLALLVAAAGWMFVALVYARGTGFPALLIDVTLAVLATFWLLGQLVLAFTSPYAAGMVGEQIVAKQLDKLPDGYVIVNDVQIGSSQIDHIVFGPTGTVCIETKHWTTAATARDGSWSQYRRGRWIPATTDPVTQNMVHVLVLRRFIQARVREAVDVRSVVVLSHQRGLYRIHSPRIGDTTICRPNRLAKVILQAPGPGLPDGTALQIAQDIIHAQPGINAGAKEGHPWL